jgi:hypothetical protein
MVEIDYDMRHAAIAQPDSWVASNSTPDTFLLLENQIVMNLREASQANQNICNRCKTLKSKQQSLVPSHSHSIKLNCKNEAGASSSHSQQEQESVKKEDTC